MLEQLEAPTSDILLKHLEIGIDHAKTAVAMDEAMDYMMAILFYKKAVSILTLTIQYLEEKLNYNDTAALLRLKKMMQVYDDRAVSLQCQVDKSANNRRLSRKPFKALGFLSPDVTETFEETHGPEKMENPPEWPPRQPFWQLRQIRRSILFGGFIGPKVFIPKEVWRQHNAKFTGLSVKESAFGSLIVQVHKHISQINFPVDDHDADCWIQAREALKPMLEQLARMHIQLARSFTFIPAHGQANKSATERGHADRPYLSRVGENAIDMLKSTVVNPTLTAYKRVEAAMPGRITTDGLAHYADLLSEVCLKLQVFDEWLVIVGTEGDSDLNTSTETEMNVKNEVRKLLLDVSQLISTVICELVIRDVQNLVERYLRKTRKSFARMYWDEDWDEKDNDDEDL